MDGKDVYFVYFLSAIAAFGGMAWAVRVATRGVVRSDRVSRIGGTALVGRGVMDWTYWLIDPVVSFLVRKGVTPNHLTWSALVLGVGAGVAVAFDLFGLCCFLATLSTLCDLLDGQVARKTNTGSDVGELLDAAVDRYTEFAFLAGLAFYYRGLAPLLGLVMGAVLASFMISYASAKAEALKVEAPRGLMRRHERAIYLITGAGFGSMFGDWLHARWDAMPTSAPEIVALAAVAVIGNGAAVLRLVRIGRQLR